MVGIKFQIRNEHDVVLDKIFKNIDLKNKYVNVQDINDFSKFSLYY